MIQSLKKVNRTAWFIPGDFTTPTKNNFDKIISSCPSLLAGVGVTHKTEKSDLPITLSQIIYNLQTN